MGACIPYALHVLDAWSACTYLSVSILDTHTTLSCNAIWSQLLAVKTAVGCNEVYGRPLVTGLQHTCVHPLATCSCPALRGALLDRPTASDRPVASSG